MTIQSTIPLTSVRFGMPANEARLTPPKTTLMVTYPGIGPYSSPYTKAIKSRTPQPHRLVYTA